MTYDVSSGTLNLTHSLPHLLLLHELMLGAVREIVNVAGNC